MPAMSNTPKMKYESKWYVADRAAHARTMAKPMRSTAKPGPEADSKALEYALWLLKRDEVDVDVLADAARTAHNLQFPPTKHRERGRSWETPHPGAIPAEMHWSTRVGWDFCAAGRRPRFVHFEFYLPQTDGWRRIAAHLYTAFYTVELPHWDFLSEATECDGEA
ncbi:hypothetical protein [Mesorhizobium sp. LSJC280B00]|uniref:hypothetical protein n=1 Tax=Mesorhizobium sp. LSJC280B00 TaxID=1287336 RepID=UPI000412D07C|nr:hypothetical protein [Mesorhizobium sp. LSJC280B00]